MKKYTLKFQDEELEEKYQIHRNHHLQNPLFYAFVGISLIVNLFLLINSLVQSLNKLPISTILTCIFDSLQLWLGIKKQKYIQQLLFVFNLVIPFYQLTIDQNYSTNEENFSYGTSLAYITTIIYFVCDFYLSVLQIIANFITTQIITAYLSKRVDYFNVILAIAAAIQVSYTVYKFDQTSRNQFLMNIKESLFLKQSKNFIPKPHFLVQLIEINKFINITYMQQFQEYDYQQIGFCFGCFGRHFLRKCISLNSQQTLEEVLFSKEIQKQQDQSLPVKYGKYNLQVKLVQYGYHDRFVVIVESGILEKVQERHVSKKAMKAIADYFTTLNNSISHNRMIKFGIISIVHLNSFKVKVINLTKFIQKLIKEFQVENIVHFIFLQNKLETRKNGNTIKLETFYNQLLIFLVQILLISEQVARHNEIIILAIGEYEDFIELQIRNSCRNEFFLMLNNNFWQPLLQNTYSMKNSILIYKLS